MQKIAITLGLMLCMSYGFASSALEIQCKTNNSAYDFVLKRSPDSGVAYALLFTPEQLETYRPLTPELISQEDDLGFSYRDLENNFTIVVDLENGEGSFQLAWNQFEEKVVSLKNCQSTVNQEN